MITERHLRVFYEVCKHMNMTKASKELFVSQPAISKTIHDIEQDYGVKLFERWNKQLYLTPEGATLYEYSKQAVNLLDAIDKSMQARNGKDIIRVGASITIGTSILGEIAADFCAEHPSVKIEALVDSTPVIEQALLQGQIDLSFVEGRLASPEIKSETVGCTDIVLVVGRTHELYGQEGITLEDLSGRDFIVREKGQPDAREVLHGDGAQQHPLEPGLGVPQHADDKKRRGRRARHRRAEQALRAQAAGERPLPGAERVRQAAGALHTHGLRREQVFFAKPHGLPAITP